MTQTFAEKNYVFDGIKRAIRWINRRIEGSRLFRWLDQTLKAARLDNVMQQYLREDPADRQHASDRG